MSGARCFECNGPMISLGAGARCFNDGTHRGEWDASGVAWATECDYCGTPGCEWQRHPQAHADVIGHRRERASNDY